MLSVEVKEEVLRVLAKHGIARAVEDRLVFLDGGQALSALVPPPSLRDCGPVWIGLEHLRQARPPVALLLTLHTDAGDFHRLVSHTSHILVTSPVCGVEAHAEQGDLPNGAIPRPEVYKTNEWLRAFQLAQFPWLDEHSILMLPCEPQFGGPLAERLEKVDNLLDSLMEGDVPGIGPGARLALLHPLYMYVSIFRAWGLIGQFGYWLSQPQVRKLLADYSGHIPLTLGAGHSPQRYMLQEYCGLDVVATVVDRHQSYPNISDEVAGRYYRRFQDVVLEQGMPLADLAIEFPI